jgi:hypothetical protein
MRIGVVSEVGISACARRIVDPLRSPNSPGWTMTHTILQYRNRRQRPKFDISS